MRCCLFRLYLLCSNRPNGPPSDPVLNVLQRSAERKMIARSSAPSVSLSVIISQGAVAGRSVRPLLGLSLVFRSVAVCTFSPRYNCGLVGSPGKLGILGDRLQAPNNSASAASRANAFADRDAATRGGLASLAP